MFRSLFLLPNIQDFDIFYLFVLHKVYLPIHLCWFFFCYVQIILIFLVLVFSTSWLNNKNFPLLLRLYESNNPYYDTLLQKSHFSFVPNILLMSFIITKVFKVFHFLRKIWLSAFWLRGYMLYTYLCPGKLLLPLALPPHLPLLLPYQCFRPLILQLYYLCCIPPEYSFTTNESITIFYSTAGNPMYWRVIYSR